MNDNTPTPSRRLDPQLDPASEPALDPAHDSDEPAFDWMKPAPATRETTAGTDGASVGGEDATARTGGSRNGAATGAAAAPAQPGSRADRKAAEAAAADTAEDSDAGSADATASSGPARGTHFSEPLPTSALQVRPPREDVERRNAEREQAANAKPVLPRILQVLLAVFYPVILLVLAVRAVTSPLFLWVEYHRPGFPGDGYGFNADDRMTYGSYAVDYLSNWSGSRYLGELVNRSGDKLFKDGEVSHMADVKLVILSAFGAGALLALISIAAVIYLRRRTPGGVRRGLFAGSIVTLVIILGLGTLAALGWQQFFTEFHRIFFASGSWTFALEDTLIRLFPGQFWIDAGIVIAALVLLTAIVTLVLTWPTRRRRGLPKAVKKDRKGDTGEAGTEAPTEVGADQPSRM
ncbi:TIGR01906 family membrane protein [Arthrobacter sp. ZGTC131]|uniref:TIGR01906 family membrane protein n=1 Tax=Arthrobacter sp. ZGTC131 TaxID=2058898 RepID=UPI000CE3551E|nr:TIGR01906 family membrane protein [Arthrobacter sp. ZGTC131]